jgi:hypothetical protein
LQQALPFQAVTDKSHRMPKPLGVMQMESNIDDDLADDIVVDLEGDRRLSKTVSEDSSSSPSGKASLARRAKTTQLPGRGVT